MSMGERILFPSDVYSSGVGRAANYETFGEQCQFHVSRQSLKSDLDLMAFQKNSIYRIQIDQTSVSKLNEAIIKYIVEYLNKRPQ